MGLKENDHRGTRQLGQKVHITVGGGNLGGAGQSTGQGVQRPRHSLQGDRNIALQGQH